MGCGSQEEEELPPLVFTCDSLTSYKNKVSSGDLSAIVKQDTSPGNNVGEHDRRRRTALQYACVFNHPDLHAKSLCISKETSAKESEQRNEKVVRSNEEVHHNTSPKPLCSELKPPRQQRLILQQSVPFHAAENEIPEQKTSISEVNPPGQQQPIFNQPLQINAVNDRPKEKSSISEAMTLKQMKSINKSSESVELCEDYPTEGPENINVSMERLSEKRDPDVPGTRIKDNDSTSCIKKTAEEQENTKSDSCSAESNYERLARLAEAQYAFAKKFNKKKREWIEASGSNTHDDAVLPSDSQGRTQSMKIAEEQENTKSDSCSAESNYERLTRLAEAQYAFAKNFNKKKREWIEASGSNTHDDAVVQSNSQGRTHSMQKLSSNQEYTYTQSKTPFAKKTREEICIQTTAIQKANTIRLIRKDDKKQMCKVYEECESNIGCNRVSISKMPKGKAYLKLLLFPDLKNHTFQDIGKDASGLAISEIV
ncbi:hypothetical protein STEG23_003470 [Scotinomys teguina]